MSEVRLSVDTRFPKVSETRFSVETRFPKVSETRFSVETRFPSCSQQQTLPNEFGEKSATKSG